MFMVKLCKEMPEMRWAAVSEQTGRDWSFYAEKGLAQGPKGQKELWRYKGGVRTFGVSIAEWQPAHKLWLETALLIHGSWFCNLGGTHRAISLLLHVLSDVATQLELVTSRHFTRVAGAGCRLGAQLGTRFSFTQALHKAAWASSSMAGETPEERHGSWQSF